MDGAKSLTTPMALPLSASASFSLPCDQSLYRQTIGELQYLALTRPDITFAVNRLAQSVSHPSEDNWTAVK